MTIGLFGKICRSNAARNGCADAQTPVQDNTPPCSSRRARDCTAGAFEMSANNLLVADEDSFCGKRGELRSARRFRQAKANHRKTDPTKRVDLGLMARGGEDANVDQNKFDGFSPINNGENTDEQAGK